MINTKQVRRTKPVKRTTQVATIAHVTVKKPESNQKTKTCTGCLKTFPLSNFYRNKSIDGGYTHMCKACYSGRYLKQTIPTRTKENHVNYTPLSEKSESTEITQYKPRVNIFDLTNDQFTEIIPENVPFTISDLLKLTGNEINANTRSKVQTRLYTLLDNKKIERLESLHDRSVIYIKKSEDLKDIKDITFESRVCLKCHEPLHSDDLKNNPHTKLCAKCNTALSVTEKPETLPTTVNEDMERLTTSMRNEIIVMNEKLSSLSEQSRSLQSIEHGMNNLQNQMGVLIRIFAANCRTVPDDVKSEYLNYN